MESKIHIFNKALAWIKTNTISGKGIAVTSEKKVIYPEVTGYFIPTLLLWGERELAASYASYLCSIQKPDGAWHDYDDKDPYVFDSAQILKGLISIRDLLPMVDDHIMKGVDWILSNMQPDGRLITPNQDAWGTNEDFCSELVHVYCLSPIRDAGRIFNRPDYLAAADKILHYYKTKKLDRIASFSLLSHFYAYVVEGLYDLGEIALARKCMENMSKYQNSKGGIRGLRNVPWVCSTGMFQLALIWYKLGELEKGNKIFYYACSLQNESGGWYGSYPASKFQNVFCWGQKKPYYFPNAEISWANKYFLDALAYKEYLEFENMAPIFLEEIDKTDGRYGLIRHFVGSYTKDAAIPIAVCDIGCGKGRYLRRLSAEYPTNDYYAMDLSENVMKDISFVKEKRTGRLTQIPYTNEAFDLVYVCEAFEHAIHLEGAFKELYRIVKNGGQFVIIDKPAEKLGQMELYEWEQWISDSKIQSYTDACGGKLEIIKSVSYEDGRDDGLFRAWIVTK